MNDLERYMNDPDIVNEPVPMREVHAIRLMLHDEAKDMTPEEHTRYVNEQVRSVVDKYGLLPNASEEAKEAGTRATASRRLIVPNDVDASA
ncbi:MAG: hypothetical protein LBS65_11620 [Desulfovibrio sp.]|jgi:hypothetical protein|nr:hypothetical protein [Desulfovibrio sp.]